MGVGYVDVGAQTPQYQGAPRYERAKRRRSLQTQADERRIRAIEKDDSAKADAMSSAAAKIGMNARGGGFKGSGLAIPFKGF